MNYTDYAFLKYKYKQEELNERDIAKKLEQFEQEQKAVREHLKFKRKAKL